MHDRLLDLPHRLPMILNPLHSPRHSLGPPIRVRVERAKIDILQLQLHIKITPVGAIVRPVVGLDVEPSLAPCRDEVVLVQTLDVSAHLVVPLGQELGRAVVGSGEVAGPIGAAAGFVGDFPGHDGGVVFVAGYHCFDVAFECFLDLGEAVELDLVSIMSVEGVPLKTNVVVVLASKIDGVDVHASVVGPVVRECYDELDADFASRVDDFVEGLDVDRRLSVRPALENDFSPAGTFAAVLWQAFGDVCDVLIVEAPRAKHVQARIFGRG